MNHYIWDGLILILLAVCLFLAYRLQKSARPKSQATRRVLQVVFCLIFVITIYGSFIEPRLIVVRHEQITLGTTAHQQIKVAVISDLHLGHYKGKKFLNSVVNKLKTENPELTLMLGDFVFDSTKAVKYLEFFKYAPGTKVAILGNHDYDIEVFNKNKDFVTDPVLAANIKGALERGGVNVLENENFNYKNQLYLMGLKELWTGETDPAKTYQEIAAKPQPKIALAHNPDVVKLLSGEKIDLFLAGHTHAGQVRLPLVGPVGHIPTKLGQHFDHGFFDYLGQKMYITGGLGESGPRARLFNWPEIVIFTINL